MKHPVSKAATIKVDVAPSTFLCVRRSALLEIALFLGAALIVDLLFLDGSRYLQTAPHPFWLIVLLVSIQYGTGEGLLAAAMASAALLVGNLPVQTLSQDPYDYLFSLTLSPLMWFLAALVLGELRMRQIRDREKLRQDLSEAVQRRDAIMASHERLSVAKEKLEVRVASEMRSAATTYQAAKAIEKLDPAEVLRGVVDVFRAVMNPGKFSLFLLTDNFLQLSMQNGWAEGDSYRRVFYPESLLFREIIGRQRLLCCAKEEDERALHGEGVLAGPLVCAHTGEMIGMLKVETLGFIDLNVSTVEAFVALCEWVGTTYANARRFQAAKAESLVSSETQLYSYGFFERQTDFMTALAKRFGFNLSLLVLRLENGEDLRPQRSSLIPSLLRRRVRKILRQTDLVFDYQRTGCEFAFVLPGNSVENAQILVDKLLDYLKKSVGEARFSATTMALHHAQSEVGPFAQEAFPRYHEILARVVAR